MKEKLGYKRKLITTSLKILDPPSSGAVGLS
jgi:hypothetical protein